MRSRGPRSRPRPLLRVFGRPDEGGAASGRGRSPRRARPLGAGLLALGALALSACTNSSALGLSVGDCLQLPTGSEAVTVETASCDSAHEAEVSALVETTPKAKDAEFPGAAVLASQAEQGCVDSFEDYVGAPYISSSLDVTWLTPTQSSWAEGDRTIVCLVHALDAQTLSSSVKGSGL